MRKYLSLMVIAALAALLLACDTSKPAGNTPPVVKNGALAVEVRGASLVADPANPPARIDCRLKEDGVVVAEWSLHNVDPGDFTISGTTLAFTRPDLPPGDYTLEIDLCWDDDDPETPECTGVTGLLTIDSDQTTDAFVDVTPLGFVDLAYPADNNSWKPTSSTTYTTPDLPGYYRPQWFRFGPIPENVSTTDALKVSLSVETGTADLYVFKPGMPPQIWSRLAITDTLSLTVADPPDGYLWACVYGSGGAASYRIRFIYGETAP